MSKKKQPPHWYNVYKGDDEAKFFRCLTRIAGYKWRSTSALSAESGLDKSCVEKIIVKYLYNGKNPIGMILQSSTNEDHWGYWEQNKEFLVDRPTSIANADKKSRIDKSMKSEFYVSAEGNVLIGDILSPSDVTAKSQWICDSPEEADKLPWIKINSPDQVESCILEAKRRKEASEYLRNLDSW
ncbi:MAG: hypothetical protein ACW99G_01295 [Candidatus Thorarchaeota archaeon]|jgi:hypothetical protein